MKMFLKYIIILFTRCISRLAFLMPLKKNQILMYSFAGKQVSDSPKYICDYIMNQPNNSKYKIIWGVNDPYKYKKLANKQISYIKYRGMKFLITYLQSEIIISNMGPIRGLARRKDQKIINTWHGGGAYKKDGSAVGYISGFELLYSEMAMKDVTVFLSSSKAFTECCIQNAYHYNGRILDVGLPRNDILFDKKRHKDIRNKVKSFFDLSDDVQIVMFAPTWRNYDLEYEQIDYTMLLRSLKERFGGEWIALHRAHSLMKTEFDSTNEGLIYDATKYPDMQELLISIDVLITDYSSSIWDYSQLKKPGFLYTPDLEFYDKVFGFSSPIDKWGFDVCSSNAKLRESILEYNEKIHLKKIKDNHDMYSSYESGHACKSVFEYIEDIS